MRLLEVGTLLAFVGCGLWVFYGTPLESEMGVSQKIMYLHLPSVLLAYLAFFVVFVCSIAYLWKRSWAFDQVAKSSAEIGLLFCAMVLVTGAIWGRPTWGTYWVWDARLTTTLLLFLIFTGYVLLRRFSSNRESEARLSAVLGIIGFLDIPIIHKSVEWWRTLHQPTTLFNVDAAGKAKPSMPPELLMPLLACLAASVLLYVYLLLMRVRIEKNQDQLKTLLATESV